MSYILNPVLVLPTYIDVCHSRHWCRCERNVSKHLPATRQQELPFIDDSWLTYLAWPLFLEDIIIIIITMTKKTIMDIIMYVVKKKGREKVIIMILI